MILNILAGFRSIPNIYKEAGRNLGMNQYQMIKDIMIPASLPYLLSGYGSVGQEPGGP
jgi:NitT/TauT family transport system permease protein